MLLTPTRKQQQAVWQAAGQKVSVEIARGMALREIHLRIKGAPTLTGGNNTVANTLLGDEWGLIKKVEIYTNGSNPILSLSGQQLKNLNRYYYDTLPLITPTLGDGATANPAFNSSLIIPLWSIRSVRPFDTVLNSGEFQSVRVDITFGTFTDINSAATAWTTSPVAYISTHESDPTELPMFLRRHLTFNKVYTGAVQGDRLALPLGPMYQGLALQVLNPGQTAELPLAIDNIRVVSGPTVFMDADEADARQINALRFGLPWGQYKTTAGIAYNSSGQVSTKADFGAWYFLDFVTDGYAVNESLDTDKMGDTYLEFNVNQACVINVITREWLRIARSK